MVPPHAPRARAAGSRFRWLYRGVALLLLFAGGGLWLHLTLDGARAPSQLAVQLDQWLVARGLGIEQVSLEGHRYTPDADIFDALDLANAGSMLRFSGTEAANRMLRLPWIQRVQIKPLVPNGLHVAITERTPYAVWEHDGRYRLIDKSGHQLAVVGAATFVDLPRVRGAGAPAAIADLHATLSLFPAIDTRLQVAERIGERRWSLLLKGGIRLQLPGEHDAAALQRLAALHADHRLLDRDLVEVDLRNAVLTVRPRSLASGPGSDAQTAPQM